MTEVYVAMFNNQELPDVMFVDTSVPFEDIEDGVIEIVAAIADGNVTIVESINDEDWNPYRDGDEDEWMDE